MKKKTSLLVFIIAAVMVFSLWPQQVNAAENAARTATADNEIGRASCRERVSMFVYLAGGGGRVE